MRILTTVFALLVLSATVARAVEITLTCGTIGSKYNICQESVNRWERMTGHTVRIIPTPKTTDDQLDFFRENLARSDAEVVLDVVKMDSIWINFVEQYLIDLRPYSEGEENTHFARLIENATYSGGLKAMPLWSGVGLLYYRSDLLEKYDAPVPRTWDELEATAARIQAAERRAGRQVWGFLFEASPGEGLTSNALEWLSAMGGAPILRPNGRVFVDDPVAMETLKRVKGWIGTLSPPDVTSLRNETARQMFQKGNVVFMRNWPYAWALSQRENSPLRGKVGVTTMPSGAGGGDTGTNGGWYLGVSKRSEHPEVAADLALFMTSQDEQLSRALFNSQNPTRPALYRDPDIRNMSGFFQTVFDGLQRSLNRPNYVLRGSYTHVSRQWSAAVHAYLDGDETDPTPRFAALQDYFERLERRGW